MQYHLTFADNFAINKGKYNIDNYEYGNGQYQWLIGVLIAAIIAATAINPNAIQPTHNRVSPLSPFIFAPHINDKNAAPTTTPK